MKQIKFNKKKFLEGLLDLKDWVKWCKDFVSIFNLRKIIIIAVLISMFAGFWYWKGLKNTQPIIDVGYKESITMPAPKGYAYLEYLAINKPKDSNKWYWINNQSKENYVAVKTGDIPESAKLRPYGLETKLIGFYGVGSGLQYTGVEAGLGYRFARLWNFRAEVIATNKGGYISASYKIKKFVFENTYLNVGLGKGYKGDDRGIIGFNVEF